MLAAREHRNHCLGHVGHESNDAVPSAHAQLAQARGGRGRLLPQLRVGQGARRSRFVGEHQRNVSVSARKAVLRVVELGSLEPAGALDAVARRRRRQDAAVGSVSLDSEEIPHGLPELLHVAHRPLPEVIVGRAAHAAALGEPAHVPRNAAPLDQLRRGRPQESALRRRSGRFAHDPTPHRLMSAHALHAAGAA